MKTIKSKKDLEKFLKKMQKMQKEDINKIISKGLATTKYTPFDVRCSDLVWDKKYQIKEIIEEREKEITEIINAISLINRINLQILNSKINI